MRKGKGHALNGLLDLAAVTATGAMLRRAPLSGIARMAAMPLVLRLVRNRAVRNVALGLAAIGLAATLLSGDHDRSEPEEDWGESDDGYTGEA